MRTEVFYTSKDIRDFKIGLISDIHYYQNFNTKVLNNITKQMVINKPNYICIAGDILDKTNITNVDPLIDWLKHLSNIAPLFIVLGNHDIKIGKHKHWLSNRNDVFIDKIKDFVNIHYLENESIVINNVCFYGFNLSFDYYEIQNETYESFCNEIKNIDSNYNDDTYNVLLFHSPINIYKYLYNNKTCNMNKSDIILSGHMHNGGIPFWITNIFNKVFRTTRSVASPDRSLFPKYAQGRVYEEKEGYIYEGITKLSKSQGFLHMFDFIYHKKVKFIEIKKK